MGMSPPTRRPLAQIALAVLNTRQPSLAPGALGIWARSPLDTRARDNFSTSTEGCTRLYHGHAQFQAGTSPRCGENEESLLRERRLNDFVDLLLSRLAGIKIPHGLRRTGR